jgi:hypothetical protein
LWGLLWGILVFGELHGRSTSLYAEVIGGSLLMAAGAGAIAFSSVGAQEHSRWEEAAKREGKRYHVASDYIQAGLSGSGANNIQDRLPSRPGRTWLDYLLVIAATAIFIGLAVLARAPNLALNWPALAGLGVALFLFLLLCGLALWRITRFH